MKFSIYLNRRVFVMEALDQPDFAAAHADLVHCCSHAFEIMSHFFRNRTICFNSINAHRRIFDANEQTCLGH